MAKKENKVVDEAIALDVQLNKSEQFIEKNLKKILCGIAAVVVVVGCYFGWNAYMNNQEEKAQAAIAKPQQTFAMGQYELALAGDSITGEGFLKIISDYSGTKTANLAKLYAAICYANTQKYDEAINMFDSYSAKGDDAISPAAIAQLGHCYIEKGETQKGIDCLVKAAKEADNAAVSPVFLLQAGQMYEIQGENDKAVELYKQIKEKYFQSQLNAEIDKYIEHATK